MAMRESSTETTRPRWNSGLPGGLSVSLGTCTYTEVKIGAPKSAELRTTKPRGGVHAHHEALAWSQAAKPGIPVYAEPRLRELDFGEYEGKVYDELKELPHYRAWIDSAGELQIPGGESSGQLRERLDAWLDDVAAHTQQYGYQKVLVVTHGGVIRELRRRFETLDFWEGIVHQAQGRRWQLAYQAGEDGKGEWQCNYSSAVPVQVSATL